MPKQGLSDPPKRYALDATPYRIAITCDWMLGGGSERVIRALCDLYPEATVFTSCTKSELIEKDFEGVKIRTGYLNWPGLKKMYKLFPVLRMLWFGSLKLDEFDLVISAGSAECKNLNTKTKHLAIIYTPTQYYWVKSDDYTKNSGGGILDPLLRLGFRILKSPMKKWDYSAAQKPDKLIAISTAVQSRIKHFYGRDSEIIFPPVGTKRFAVLKPKPADAPESYLLVVGRQVPYKRFDLAIDAAKILGRNLVVIGSGPEHNRLVEMAKGAEEKVLFPASISDEEIVGYFQHADALLFPGEEDFGITAVEALAAGTPVVAYKAGGALDYIKPGVNGEFSEVLSAESLAEAVKRLKARKGQEIAGTSLEFNDELFKQRIGAKIQEVLRT